METGAMEETEGMVVETGAMEVDIPTGVEVAILLEVVEAITTEITGEPPVLLSLT